MLGNLSDFNIEKNKVDFKDLTYFDQVMMMRLNKLNKKVLEDYNNFDFQQATVAMSVFMNNDLSSYYLDIIKDILYIEKEDSLRRRQVQTVVWNMANALLKLWAPIIVFTAEEINDHFMNHDSIHNTKFEQVEDYSDFEGLLAELSQLEGLRDEVLKALELMREQKVIGKPLEAAVSLNVEKDVRDLLDKFFKDHINQWLTVSTVTFDLDQSEKIVVSKADGEVCPRCWNVRVSSREDHLCDRCATVLD